MLCTNIPHAEGRRRDALFGKSFLVCLCYRIVVRLEQKLGPVLVFGRNDREPLEFSDRHIVLFNEAQKGFRYSNFRASSVDASSTKTRLSYGAFIVIPAAFQLPIQPVSPVWVTPE